MMKIIGIRNSAAKPCVSRKSDCSSLVMRAQNISVAQGSVGESHEEILQVLPPKLGVADGDAGLAQGGRQRRGRTSGRRRTSKASPVTVTSPKVASMAAAFSGGFASANVTRVLAASVLSSASSLPWIRTLP